jgi:hypothetical protein
MAYRYLIYSTGTTFSGTIVRESATNNPGGNEAALYTDFIIPAIQPLYLWQVSAGTVIPNTDPNIDAYEISIAPAPQSKDNITYGEVTGITVQKLAISDFDTYTDVTESRIGGIEGDIIFISGVTDTKLATAAFDIYSGLTKTVISTKVDKVTGATAGNIATFIAGGNIADTGLNAADIVAHGSGVSTTQFNLYTGATKIELEGIEGDVSFISGVTDTKLATAAFDIYSGVTESRIEGIEGDVSFISGVTDTKLATAAFDIYSGVTDTFIKTKLDKSAFTGYTDSIKNVDKKIQVVSTSTASANTVAATKIPWNSAPVSADTYLWSGGTAVWIKSAGTYEVQYHVLLNNDAANQTHSIGGSLLKNGATEEYTSTAGMIIGPNMKAELSLPPAVLTLAVNDRLDLIVFRIGNTGNVNLVSGLVHLMLNKLT